MKQNKVKNPESACIYSLKYLLDGYKDVMISVSQKAPAGRFIFRQLSQIIEDINEIYLIELVKISARKWQIVMVSTNNNSYNVEDDNFFLSPANYELRRITDQTSIYLYYSFFGVKLENVCTKELELYPKLFEVTDEYGKIFTQE